MENTGTNSVTQITKILVVAGFENSSDKVAMIHISDCEELTSDEIYEKVIAIENQLREKQSPSKRRDSIYCYWITSPETIKNIDSKFDNSKISVKSSESVINRTYVVGKVLTIDEALTMSSNNQFSAEEKNILLNFISHTLKLDLENMSSEDLLVKIIMIPGEFKKKTFFQIFTKNDVLKKIPQEKLVEIKY